jgi:hypothetical protein
MWMPLLFFINGGEEMNSTRNLKTPGQDGGINLKMSSDPCCFGDTYKELKEK